MVSRLLQVITGLDAMVKSGVTRNVTTRFQTITGMSCYCEKSIDVSQFDSSGWRVQYAQAKWLLFRPAAQS